MNELILTVTNHLLLERRVPYSEFLFISYYNITNGADVTTTEPETIPIAFSIAPLIPVGIQHREREMPGTFRIKIVRTGIRHFGVLSGVLRHNNLL